MIPEIPRQMKGPGTEAARPPQAPAALAPPAGGFVSGRLVELCQSPSSPNPQTVFL